MQNIPVRTKEGRQIRTAFVAEPGKKLISADYSQIELRVLAHMADIPELKRAFAEGLDIHAMTASEMFGVPIKDMPSEVRRRAKAINFGIVYGISAFGLAQQLGIGRSEAGDYIAKYFERFPGIRTYMDATRAKVREDGYVETLFGRKIHFPEIDTPQRNMRAFFERAAINAPIQGTAADILRRAMIRMPAALAAAKLSARMLLASARRACVRGARCRGRGHDQGRRPRDGARRRARRGLLRAAEGRCPRRPQLGRGALNWLSPPLFLPEVLID